jgi:hypothetical protein
MWPLAGEPVPAHDVAEVAQTVGLVVVGILGSAGALRLVIAAVASKRGHLAIASMQSRSAAVSRAPGSGESRLQTSGKSAG